MAFRIPTEVNTTLKTNQDLRALVLTSLTSDVSANVDLYNTLQAEGLTVAEAAAQANPETTRKLITFNIAVTGTATEAAVEAALIAHVNTLGTGADVIAATASAVVAAVPDVTSVDTFELSLDGDPTGETSDLTIAADEIAYATADSITYAAS